MRVSVRMYNAGTLILQIISFNETYYLKNQSSIMQEL